MSLLMPTCQEASELAVRRECGSLSFMGRLRLRYHLTICTVCRAFELQMRVITKGARHVHTPAEMSEECEKRMRERLNDEMHKS